MPRPPVAEQCQFRPCSRKRAVVITWCGRAFDVCRGHAEYDGGHASTCRCEPADREPVDEQSGSAAAEPDPDRIAAAVLAVVDQLAPDGQRAVLRFAETLAGQHRS